MREIAFWLFCLLIKVRDYIGDYIFVPKEKVIHCLCQRGVKSWNIFSFFFTIQSIRGVLKSDMECVGANNI